MTPIITLLTALGILGALYTVVWSRAFGGPNLLQLAIGLVTDFLDTWGIGSYATTTALFKFFKQCPDRLIPGTLNVGHGIPTIVQAFIFISSVKVDPATLIAMIVSAVAGAWIGAGIVAGWPKRKIQIGMGIALGVAALLLLRELLQGKVQSAEDATTLTGVRLAIGVAVNFVLGALMTLGIGLYAPCMILVSLLGMNVDAAFPIMMGSCAFLMPIASYRFIQAKSYAPIPALGLAIAGVPGVLLAHFVFEKAGMDTIRWVVLGVVVYTSIVMLVSAFSAKSEERAPELQGS